MEALDAARCERHYLHLLFGTKTSTVFLSKRRKFLDFKPSVNVSPQIISTNYRMIFKFGIVT